MPHVTPATAAALRTALGAVAVARAQFGAGLAALILALLARLLGRADAAWDLSPEHDWDCEYDDEAFAYSPRAFILPTMGSAPHAASVEAGLIPDWILAGVRNRGMRAQPTQARPRPRTLPARAPP
jgi:hypothetical protein